MKREYPASNLLLRLLDNLGKMQTLNLRQVKRKSLESIVNSGLFAVVQTEGFLFLLFLFLVCFVLLPMLVLCTATIGISPSSCPHSEWDTMSGTGQGDSIVSIGAGALAYLSGGAFLLKVTWRFQSRTYSHPTSTVGVSCRCHFPHSDSSKWNRISRHPEGSTEN